MINLAFFAVRGGTFTQSRISLTERGLFGGWHKFASGFIQAPIAAFPFFRRALPLTAIKFAEGRVFRNVLDNLVSEPPPDPTNGLVAFHGNFLFHLENGTIVCPSGLFATL